MVNGSVTAGRAVKVSSQVQSSAWPETRNSSLHVPVRGQVDAASPPGEVSRAERFGRRRADGKRPVRLERAQQVGEGGHERPCRVSGTDSGPNSGHRVISTGPASSKLAVRASSSSSATRSSILAQIAPGQ